MSPRNILNNLKYSYKKSKNKMMIKFNNKLKQKDNKSLKLSQ